MYKSIILGAVQGLAEWLPISSEGLILLTNIKFFGGGELTDMIKQALFLHLGTFLAALIYFRSDVVKLVKTLFSYSSSDTETKKIFNFLFLATLISGILGFILLELLGNLESSIELTGKVVTLIIGLLLLVTGIMQIRSSDFGLREAVDLKLKDSILLGLVQGLASLPGFSRSGLTVSTLLLRKFEKAAALRLSFLLSLPVVLVGNIVLNFERFSVRIEDILGLISSFVVGILTIHLLLNLAKRINFGYFVMIFGVLAIISVLL